MSASDAGMSSPLFLDEVLVEAIPFSALDRRLSSHSCCSSRGTKQSIMKDWVLYLLSILPGYFFKAFGGFMVVKTLDKLSSWFFSPLWKLPGPRGGGFLVGIFPSIRKEPYFDPHKQWLKELGHDTKLIHYTTLLGRHSVVVYDKELVKQVLMAPAGQKNTRFNKNHDFLKYIVGDGLITLEAVKWKRHRRIIQPSFSSGYLKERLNDVVPAIAQQLVEYWKQAQGREIDVESHLSAIALDVIGHVGFSHSFHAMDEVKKWAKHADQTQLAELSDPFISSILQALKPNLVTLVLNTFGMASLDNFFNAKSRKVSRLLNQAVDQVVANAAQSSSKSSKKSLLQLLFDATDDAIPSTTGLRRTLNHAELRDETKTFLMAGHETTSTWCYWAIFVLAHHPDIQDKVYADITKHTTGKNGSTSITYDIVEEMEYFHAFLQEVLRLYPPVGLVVRTNARNEDLDGHDIPAGTRLVLPIHLLHRHPHYWDQPDKFLPERWLNNSSGTTTTTIKNNDERIRFAFLPFSAGGRNCIGQRFATIEAKLILAPLIQQFRFQVAPSQRDTDFKFTGFVVMKSKPALKVVAVSRT